jgi:hypothetical protein
MERALIIAALGTALSLSGVQAAELAFDSEAECRSISEAVVPSCRCQGLYFANKFGSDEGAAALHLVGRSYVSEPQLPVTSLYERFGAAKLDKIAQKILETRGEVVSYCPFSTHLDD